MRPSFFTPFFLLLTCANLFAESVAASSALGALRLLPRGEAKRLAIIEAREGTPVPQRWHFIVHDPKSETGVHEYVIAGGEIVASRDVSQFAESLRPEDVIGNDGLKVNSDRAARLAQDYAIANNMTVATMQYALKKSGAAAAPLWNVTCLDDAGKELGHLVISAAKGTVVSHEGFAAEPPPPPPPATPVRTPPVRHTPKPEDRLRAPAAIAAEPKTTPVPVEWPVAEPIFPPTTPVPKKPGLFDRMGESFQKVFTGKERKPPAE
jgi:hypothetical protein